MSIPRMPRSLASMVFERRNMLMNRATHNIITAAESAGVNARSERIHCRSLMTPIRKSAPSSIKKFKGRRTKSARVVQTGVS